MSWPTRWAAGWGLPQGRAWRSQPVQIEGFDSECPLAGTPCCLNLTLFVLFPSPSSCFPHGSNFHAAGCGELGGRGLGTPLCPAPEAHKAMWADPRLTAARPGPRPRLLFRITTNTALDKMDPQEPASWIAHAVILRSPGRAAGGRALVSQGPIRKLEMSVSDRRNPCTAEEDALASRLERGGVRAAAVQSAAALPALAQVRNAHRCGGGAGTGAWP